MCVCLAAIFSGIETIPFHPDESTNLYLAQDFGRLVASPGALAWRAEAVGNLMQHYRLVDAPVTRYLLGAGLMLPGQSPLPIDWNWGQSYTANRQAGALPSPGQLWAGRFFLSLLLIPGMALLYLLGRRLGGEVTGLLAVLLFGLSALTQLHARRAMGEASLTFSIILATAGFILGGRRAWLAGLCMALAFNSKHSALPLLPVGLLAVLWIPERKLTWGKAASALVQYLGVFTLVTWALNPFMWRSPINALTAALNERQALVTAQTADVQRMAPELVLHSPGQRLLAVTVNLYFAPLQFGEFGNVRQEIASAELAYLAAPWHTGLRSLWGGGFLLTLTLAGVLLSLWGLPRAGPTHRRALALLLLCTLALLSGILLIVPLPWQRYVVPLVPLAALWQSLVFARPVKQKTALPTEPFSEH